jgi:hypothetical protein
MQSWVSYKSFHPLWCWVWLVSLWEMVSHPSRCDLTVVRIDDVVWARLEWWRRLDPSGDVACHARILGVDTLGQHVPPRVQYGTTCLLISYAISYVPCSVEWGWHHILWSVFVTYFVNYLNHMVQEGAFVWETLALQVGTICRETVAKHDILL